MTKGLPLQNFKQLTRKLTIQKINENSKYLKILECADHKFHRKVAKETIPQPNHILIEQGINLKSVLTQ